MLATATATATATAMAHSIAAPHDRLSPELRDFIDRLIASVSADDAAKAVHLHKGLTQLESFVQREHGGISSFEEIVARDSAMWQEHVQRARDDCEVRVQLRPLLPSVAGLRQAHDIKVGRPGRPDDAVYQSSQYAREWLPRGNFIAELERNKPAPPLPAPVAAAVAAPAQEKRKRSRRRNKKQSTTPSPEPVQVNPESGVQAQTTESTARAIDTEVLYFPLVRGYRKFTGQEDDGELKAQTEDETELLSKFFTKPQMQSRWVISTTKENGEAGHLAVLKLQDGAFVFALGSKSTHFVARTLEDVELAREEHKRVAGNDPFLAAAPIATAILRLIFALEPEKRELLCEFLWQTRATASFEVLCPDHQHVQLLDYLSENTPVFYGLSLPASSPLEGAEVCVNPVLPFELLRALGVRTVAYDVVEYQPEAFEAALERSKRAYQHEGGVHLFLDAGAAVIGMQKHKSVWYVCLRAIREKAKSFCNTLYPRKKSTNGLEPNQALANAKMAVEKRFRAIPAFLHISDEVCDAYEQLGERFLDFLFEEKLFRGQPSDTEHEEQARGTVTQVADLFPVLWKQFLSHTGLDDAIE